MQEPELPSRRDSLLSPSEEDLALEVEKSSSAPQPRPTLHRDDRHFSGEAVVDEEIRPEERGRVRFRSSWWFARCDRDIVLPPDTRVQVIGLEKETMTLLVVPYAEKKQDTQSREKQAAANSVSEESGSILAPQPEAN